MKENNNILQRARDLDLTEEELRELYSDKEKLDQLYDEVLIDNVTEDLFIPGKSQLVRQKKLEIEGLTKITKSNKRNYSSISNLKFIGIAASILILSGAYLLLKPQSSELTEKQIAEFIEISKSAYSPQVIASLERSNDVKVNQSLVTAYIEKNYEHILEQTKGELQNAEIMLLRARVLMDLDRYEEGYMIMQSINDQELIQQDVYLWMMAEGALNLSDFDTLKKTLGNIIEQHLPNSNKVKYIFHKSI